MGKFYNYYPIGEPNLDSFQLIFINSENAGKKTKRLYV